MRINRLWQRLIRTARRCSGPPPAASEQAAGLEYRPGRPYAPGPLPGQCAEAAGRPVPDTRAFLVWIGGRKRIRVMRGSYRVGDFETPEQIEQAGVDLATLRIEDRGIR